MEAALRFYEKEYAILARLFDDDSLIAFTCINLMSPEQMVELEKRLKEKREQLRRNEMTPRTDREIWWVGFKPDERLEAVWADFARDLEKENAELRKDKERLDYMEQNVDFVSWRFYGKPQSWDLRAAVDSKMKEAQP